MSNRLIIWFVTLILFISLGAGVISIISIAEQRIQNKEIAAATLRFRSTQEKINLVEQKTNYLAISYHLKNVAANCETDHDLVIVFGESAVGVSSATAIARRDAPFKATYTTCLKELVEAKATLAKTLP
jgi:hypothetical protein